ncbi:hypothetical protein [Halomonas sp. 3H]|uniref:hypothetical protein n=1 Tax=Halomonas sp. 3H TaxID=2952527 RepID=UPI0020B8C43A|nr:hypothetical protein [Halomonas sp. 3H]
MASVEVPGSERFWTETRGEHDIYYRGEAIEEGDLASLRGGFRIGGMELAFGAELTTLIDEQVQLVSLVNITPSGVDLVSRTLSDPTGQASLVGPGTGVRITDLTPNGVDLTGLAGFSGMTLEDTRGFTAALHQITNSAILSGVVTNASGTAIDQRIDIQVRASNVGQLQMARQRQAIVDAFPGLLR